ncbi:MAG: DNA-binding protein [[Eubacterium] siraeum]
MFEYMTVQEAAKLWSLSERRVQKLCECNRINNVVRLSRVWLIPKNAKKPADGRYKTNKNQDGVAER